MRYKVRHKSTLSYAAPVARARFSVRLTPRARIGQAITEATLAFSPDPSTREDHEGPYWVNTTHIGFDAALKNLEVTSTFMVDQAERVLPGHGPGLEQVRNEALETADLRELAPAPYLFASRIATLNHAISGWAAPHFLPHGDAVVAVTHLMGAIHREFAYAPGKTNSRTPPEDAFERRHGVCQDFAHIMIMALRAHGVPAAYVSGYLLTHPAPGREKLVGADAMHAWVDVWCGHQIGWVGFDPTNDCLANDEHIAIAMGRDYADVSPIDGTFIGSAPQSMASAVDVERID